MKFLPVLALLLLALFTNCEKDPQIITETIVKTDTLIVTQIDTVVVQITDTITLTQWIKDTGTTFILLRHAETTGTGADPGLSAAGQKRADELVRVLGAVPLQAIYSTNFNRTRQTVQPLAAQIGAGIQTYSAFAYDQLIDKVLNEQGHGTVVVVGHSNMVPELLNVLIGANAYSQLSESQYDNLFIATVLEKGRAQVVHLRYGDPTP